MKEKKLIIIILLAIFILIIISFVVQNRIKESEKNNIQNSTQSVSNAMQNVVINNSSNADNSINDVATENKINSVQNNEITKTPEELYKELLLNEEWIKENLYLKKDCFGNEIPSSSKQTVKYMKVEEGFSNPIVIVWTQCNEKTSNQSFILTYEAGEVKVKELEEKVGHSDHVILGVNFTKKILYKKISYTLSTEYDIYNLTDEGTSMEYILKEDYSDTSNTVYYINDKISSLEEYRNLRNEYIAGSTEETDFKALNKKNINESFQ